MFFDAQPKEFEPLEKEMMDDMLAVWEEDLIAESKLNKPRLDTPIIQTTA